MRTSILTTQQVNTLRRCEAIIERGLKTFIEVGKALMQIREERLYLRDYETFTDYCRERWGFDRNYAKRLIHSAEVVSNLQTVPIGTLPATESQARPLAQLPVEQQADAWQDVVIQCRERGVPVTGAAVAEVAEKYKAQAEPYRETRTGQPPAAKRHPGMPPEAPEHPLLHKLADLLNKCRDRSLTLDASRICHFYFPTDLSSHFRSQDLPHGELYRDLSAAIRATINQLGLSANMAVVVLEELVVEFRKRADLGETEEAGSSAANSGEPVTEEASGQ